MPINRDELSKEMVMAAMQCKDADELIALAKTDGYDITKEEAEAFLAELDDVELDDKTLKNVAGGDSCYGEDNECRFHDPGATPWRGKV